MRPPKEEREKKLIATIEALTVGFRHSTDSIHVLDDVNDDIDRDLTIHDNEAYHGHFKACCLRTFEMNYGYQESYQ